MRERLPSTGVDFVPLGFRPRIAASEVCPALPPDLERVFRTSAWYDALNTHDDGQGD